MDFRTETAVDLAAQVRDGRRTAGELVEHALSQIAEHNSALNAFVAVDGTRARAGAAAVDAKVAAGIDPGPLAGIPIGVKDLEDAAGFVTTRGSMGYADTPVASSDSELVARLVAAGCVVVGKTNTPELGWKADTDNPLFGPTYNPWNLAHTPGRLLGRERGGHRFGNGAAGHRIGRGRFAAHPIGLLWSVGHEAVARAGAEWRIQCAGLAPPVHQGPDGPSPVGRGSCSGRGRRT